MITTDVPEISIQFLGTGTSSGVPMIGCKCRVCTSNNPKDKRLRSSVLVRSENTTVVIDTTPDFRYQMLRIDNRQLDGILLTHPHKDHIAGLDDVRAYNFLQQTPLPIFTNAHTAVVVEKEFYYAFANEKYPGVPQLNINVINTDPFSVGNIRVQPINVWHHKMPVTGFRFGNITYITDANRIDKEEKEKIIGSKLLIVNALRREKHLSHFTLNEALELADELQVEKAFFTHISHQLGLHDEVSETLPPNRFLAYDGLKLVV